MIRVKGQLWLLSLCLLRRLSADFAACSVSCYHLSIASSVQADYDKLCKNTWIVGVAADSSTNGSGTPMSDL